MKLRSDSAPQCKHVIVIGPFKFQPNGSIQCFVLLSHPFLDSPNMHCSFSHWWIICTWCFSSSNNLRLTLCTSCFQLSWFCMYTCNSWREISRLLDVIVSTVASNENYHYYMTVVVSMWLERKCCHLCNWILQHKLTHVVRKHWAFTLSSEFLTLLKTVKGNIVIHMCSLVS